MPTQIVTQSGLPRTCDYVAAASGVADPTSMNSLPTRSRSMNSGTGSSTKNAVRSRAIPVKTVEASSYAGILDESAPVLDETTQPTP